MAYQWSLVASRPTMGLSNFPRSFVQPGCFSMAQQGLPVFHGTFMSASSGLVSVPECESGWRGAHIGDLSASGQWSVHWQDQHINVLELRAVMLALKSFLHAIPHCHVLLSTDITIVAAYLNKKGGGGAGPEPCHSWRPIC